MKDKVLALLSALVKGNELIVKAPKGLVAQDRALLETGANVKGPDQGRTIAHGLQINVDGETALAVSQGRLQGGVSEIAPAVTRGHVQGNEVAAPTAVRAPLPVHDHVRPHLQSKKQDIMAGMEDLIRKRDTVYKEVEKNLRQALVLMMP